MANIDLLPIKTQALSDSVDCREIVLDSNCPYSDVGLIFNQLESNSRFLKIIFMIGGRQVLLNSSINQAHLFLRKPDGKNIVNPCYVDDTENVIYCEIDTQAIILNGIDKVQIALFGYNSSTKKSSTIISTEFSIIVNKCVVDSDITSTDVYETFIMKLNDMNTYDGRLLIAEANDADIASKLGNTDISAIGDGTVTGAISTINSDGKITEKTTVASVSGTDKVIINQGDAVKQATVDTLVNGSSLNTKVGLLESLTTGVKTSIVNAINWVVTQLNTVNEKIGTTDISAIGNGTVTGAISTVNQSLTSKQTGYTSASASQTFNYNVSRIIGNVVYVNVCFSKSTQISQGDNLFSLNLNGTLLKPLTTVKQLSLYVNNAQTDTCGFATSGNTPFVVAPCVIASGADIKIIGTYLIG